MGIKVGVSIGHYLLSLPISTLCIDEEEEVVA
jgi:hypothetical protein